MRIRHATFRLAPNWVEQMVASKDVAQEILEAMEGMQVTVRYAGEAVGRVLRGKDVAIEVTGSTGKRPHLNLEMPAGDLDLALVDFEVVAPRVISGFFDVVFEVAEPRRSGGGWTGAVTGERTYFTVGTVRGAWIGSPKAEA